jgi:hypothetical protein
MPRSPRRIMTDDRGSPLRTDFENPSLIARQGPGNWRLLPAIACPGEGVVSREFSEELSGCLVVEALQTGVIVVGDEGEEVGIAFGMVEKAAVMGGAALRHPVEMLAKAAVEAFDHAVGLRPEGLGKAMGDGALDADAIEGMLARGFVVGFGLFVDGEAVGELGAVVGQDGMDLEREMAEEAGRGGAPAIGQDFEIDKAGGAVAIAT